MTRFRYRPRRSNRTYIRREGDVREELFLWRKDASEMRNLAGDPAIKLTVERMRQALAVSRPDH